MKETSGMRGQKRGQKYMVWLAVLLFILPLSGCITDREPEKIGDLTYSMVAYEKLPEALKQVILKKKEAPFKLTYSNEGRLYIAVGYGKQETAGYSIQVPEIYYTKESVVIVTKLIGPEKEEAKQESFPYVVVQIEDKNLPVIFK